MNEPTLPMVDPSASPSQSSLSGGIIGSVATAASVDSPTLSHDRKSISKEWIKKVNDVISTTKDDPHAQVTMMYKLKSDYLLQTFNKELKAVE